MNSMQDKKTKNKITTSSKFLSLVLRHNPGLIGLTLDEAGWAEIDELVRKAGKSGQSLTVELIHEIVKTSDKQRFAINAEGSHIRANQGHSVQVDLGLPIKVPPLHLFHGTARRFMTTIEKEGLTKRARHHVHLTTDIGVATSVGQRYGEVTLLQVDAARMHTAGHVFYLSENGVWLTDSVPPKYLIQLPLHTN
jgi:putative RNA 2'-phosphotransferase